MKKINLLVTAAITVAGFTACNSSSDAAKQDAVNFNNYVDSVDKTTRVYTTANWTTIDNAYQERMALAEKTAAELNAEEKARLEESKAKYAKLKAEYEAKLKEGEAEAKMTSTAPDYRTALRSRLFGEGKVGADMKFEYVTAANIHDVYKNFVNTVADNRDSYSREDWDEIKVLYEALDTRKNAVEKDLSGSDNRQIALLKIKFAAIKATNRGGTKGAENQAAKEQK